MINVTEHDMPTWWKDEVDKLMGRLNFNRLVEFKLKQAPLYKWTDTITPEEARDDLFELAHRLVLDTSVRAAISNNGKAQTECGNIMVMVECEDNTFSKKTTTMNVYFVIASAESYDDADS